MKPLFKSASIALAGIFMMILLYSFSDVKGGDSFQVYVNGKMVVDQHVAMAKGVSYRNLSLSPTDKKVELFYSHCGQQGNKRVITIKNEALQTLKQWQFADEKTRTFMSCEVKDILALQKKNSKLNLYYSSKELPEGKLLVSINAGTKYEVRGTK